MKNSVKKGFTLVELLVVIGIIGILAAIVMASLATAKGRGRDARRVGDVKQLQQAVENYFENNGAYPADLKDSELLKLMAGNPTDPQTGASYNYVMTADPAAYCIGTNFESGVPSAAGVSSQCLIDEKFNSNNNYVVTGP